MDRRRDEPHRREVTGEPLEVLTGQTVDISILLCLFLGRRICYTI
jgi:hypothetical protein